MVASVVAASAVVVALVVAASGAFTVVTRSWGRRKEKGEGERTRWFERAGAKMNSSFNL